MNKTQNNFEQIIQGNTPVLVDFYADWCMPCRMLSPILKNLAAELGDELRIIKIDIDKNPQIAKMYSIYSVPTIFIFQDGEVVWKGSGARSKEELKRIIRSETRVYQTF